MKHFVIYCGFWLLMVFGAYLVLGWAMNVRYALGQSSCNPQDPICREWMLRNIELMAKTATEAVEKLDEALNDQSSRTENILAESRYRLEKNEVTGRYRITERVQCPKEGTPQGVINEWVEIVNDQTYDCPNWSNCPLSLCKRWPEERLIKYLERLRAKEQAEKAWKPIK